MAENDLNDEENAIIAFCEIFDIPYEEFIDHLVGFVCDKEDAGHFKRQIKWYYENVRY